MNTNTFKATTCMLVHVKDCSTGSMGYSNAIFLPGYWLSLP